MSEENTNIIQENEASESPAAEAAESAEPVAAEMTETAAPEPVEATSEALEAVPEPEPEATEAVDPVFSGAVFSEEAILTSAAEEPGPAAAEEPRPAATEEPEPAAAESPEPAASEPSEPAFPEPSEPVSPEPSEADAPDNPEPETPDGTDLEQEKARRGVPKHAFILTAVGIVLLGAIITAVLLFLNSPVTVEEAYEFAADYEGILLEPGQTAQIRSELTPLTEKLEFRAQEDFQSKSFEYTSGDEEVVSVNETGLVTALAPGETTVTVRFSSFSESFPVRVYIPVTNVKLTQSGISMNVGDKFFLNWKIEPADATELPEPPTFTSSDESVATVDEMGKISAVGPGDAVITMKSGEYTSEFAVTARSPLKGIEVTGDQPELLLGESYSFSVSPVPANTTDTIHPEYRSSDESVATVDSEGNVTGVGPGSATITVREGRFFKYYDLFVKVPLTGVTLGFNTFTLRNGDSVQLPYAIEPANTNEEVTITWSSDNTGVLQVNQEGVVTAVGPGTANVTVSANEFSASCQITVIIPVTGVVISTGALSLNKGQSAQLAASVVPANTTEVPYINWASDNTAVATVDGNGVVTAIGPGYATITAYHEAAAAACGVSVFSPMTGIQFTQTDISIIETYTAQLSVIYLPDDTTDPKDTSFMTDNPEVATVDPNGVITAVSVGSCTVTALCNGMSCVASVTVTELIEVESITLDQGALEFAESGQTAQLHASVLPEDATDASIVWTSTNTLVATVDGAGLVTAVGGGDCMITASAGGRSASCSVHVAAANKIVVLDPGHSATFTGASYNGYMEHIINLTVAMACKSYLESHYAGVTVYLTRYDHSPVDGSSLKADLERRAQIAQDYKADILVSLHFNATVNHNAAGCLAFVSYQPNVAGQCNALANSILAQISALGINNLGPITTASNQYFDDFGNPLDYYAINRHCANRGIPGIIVEHCFMDTQPQFLDDGHLQQLGAADAVGIANYLGLAAK